ncbi:MAG: spore germination protein [Pelosinus sp.]|nr:spore germination protein [Pelosinus sp.]
MKAKNQRFHKLSVIQPAACLSKTQRELTKLQKQVQQSKEIAALLSTIVKDLRKAAAPEGEPFQFTDDISINEQLVRSVLLRCDDMVYRTFLAGNRKALLVYASSLTDTEKLENTVLSCLTGRLNSTQPLDVNQIINILITAANVAVVSKASLVFGNILKGNALLLIDGFSQVFLIEALKYDKRAISKAENEDAARGPHDAFNETLSDNIGLVRHRSNDPDLKVEIFAIGARTQTSVAMLYVDDIVKPGLVDEVRKDLLSIRIDKVILAANIEEFLDGQIWSPFPQALSTERPDKIIASLYEGRIGIIVDNSPTALVVPATLQDFMQAVDDYTERPIIASVIRLTRYVAALFAVFLPALYVSVVSYHPGILPSGLAISIAELRAKTPFPSLLEAFLMEALLEIFQEAIVRLPQKLSAAAGVVGALVIGTTVVEAALVNALLVVVVALTGLSSFSMPSYTFGLALRFFRIAALLSAAVLGLYGLIISAIVMMVYLCSLRSYDESYLGNLLDITLLSDWKDGLVRLPYKFLKARPKRFGAKDKKRLGGGI